MQNHVGDFLRPKDLNSFCNTNKSLKKSLTASRNKKIIELSEKLKPYFKVPTEGMTPQQIIETIKNLAYVSPHDLDVLESPVLWENIFPDPDVRVNPADIYKLFFETNMPFDEQMFHDGIFHGHREYLELVIENYDKEQMRQLLSSGKYNGLFNEMLENLNTTDQEIYLITNILLKCGLNMEEDMVAAVLLNAPERGLPKILKMMLFEYGLAPEAKDYHGRTPLMLALRGYNPDEETVKILLEYDVDMDTEDNDGDDVFSDINIKKNFWETDSQFESRCDRINNIIIPLLYEKKKETIDTAQTILKEETNTTVYLEEILKNMDYPLARNIVIKYKKQLKTSSSATITSTPTTTPSLNPLSQFAHRA